MKSPDWKLLEKILFGIIVTVVEGLIVFGLVGLNGFCTPYLIPCWIWGSILWVVLMLTTYYVVVRGGWWIANKIGIWIKRNPLSENLYVESGSLIDNTFTLMFESEEWRLLFHRTEAFMNIYPFIPDRNPSYPYDKLEWRNEKVSQPIKIIRFIPYTINFLEIDPKSNTFWIKTRRNKNCKFPCGEYGFEIEVVQNIYIDRINAKSVRPKIYLVVNYAGQRNISVRKASKEEYEKHAWHKQIGFGNRTVSNS